MHMKVKRFMLALLIISICAFTFTALGNTTYVEASDDSSSYTLQDSIVDPSYEQYYNDNLETWLSKYNCYAFALNRFHIAQSPNGQGYNIGNFCGIDYNELTTIDQYLDTIEKDMLALHFSDISFSTTLPTNIQSDETLLCVRLAIDSNDNITDYHFMRYDKDTNVWKHKPGASKILIYNYEPSNDRLWLSEGIDLFDIYIGNDDVVYNSPIYYIKYTDPFEYNVLTNRYVIDSYEDLKNIRYFPNKGWEFSASVSISNTETWEPIENFSGNIYGNGYTVSGLKFKGNKIGKYGFILTNQGQIHDLNFINSYINITGNVDLSKTITVGVIAAENNGEIRRCNVGNIQYYAEITIMSSVRSYVGAICGINRHNGTDGTINNCHVTNFHAALAGDLGGICGINDYNSTVTNCSVSSSGLSLYYGTAGGIAATNYGVVENSALYSTEISCYNGFPDLLPSYYPAYHYAYVGGISGLNIMPLEATDSYVLNVKACSVSNSKLICASDYVDADHGGRSFAPEMGLISGLSYSNYLQNNTYSNSSVSGPNLTTLTWKGGFLNLQTYSWNQAQYIGNRPIGREM